MSESIPVISIPVDNSGLEKAVSLFEKLTQYAEKYKNTETPARAYPYLHPQAEGCHRLRALPG